MIRLTRIAFVLLGTFCYVQALRYGLREEFDFAVIYGATAANAWFLGLSDTWDLAKV